MKTRFWFLKNIIMIKNFITQVLALGIAAYPRVKEYSRWSYFSLQGISLSFFERLFAGKKDTSVKPDPLGERPLKINKYLYRIKYTIYILLLNLITILIFTNKQLVANSHHPENISRSDYKIFLKQKPVKAKVSYSAPTVVFRFLIRIFQNVFSPQDGPACPYTPTCSAYGRQAIHRHGIFKGTMLTADRLIRCNPSSSGGKDPVPK